MAMRNKASRFVLLITCLMYLIFYVDRVNISTAAPFMQKDLGLTATQLGLAFSAFAYPYAFFQIAGGWLGDRLGPRVTLALCAALVGLATIWTGFVGGLAALFLSRLALGMGEGPAFPTATRALANWMRPDQRAFAQGITHAFSRAGNALTPPLIALIVVSFSWRDSFIFLGVAALIWAVVWFIYFRDDPRTHSQITPEELTGLPPATVVATRKSVPWGPLLKRIMPVTLTDFCYGWILWLYLNWLPSFFLHEFNLNIKKSALFAAGVFLAGVVGDTVGGLLSDRILKKTGDVNKARVSVIVLGFLGSFCFMLPIVFVHDLTTVATCLSFAFFFAELIVAPIWAIPMDIAPEFSGSASGFMNFGFGMAGIISPVVFGYAIDLTGRWDVPFIGSLAFLLIGAMLAFTCKPGERFVDVRSDPTAPRPTPA
ncbi:MFS transporter [[Pseudomonas] carboxydohydrogena]|uniref:MFS transporter n=1 Tax=Afipia carboxydohydrogena TaxID=290 RepID=A0ABY8BMF2_AFICR|nr:MFS transporter [[Pseudomonas] carboxydohydrogena]WEF50666.1 MFS transporter [[Pseudomonas] carboxydohydrogena]